MRSEEEDLRVGEIGASVASQPTMKTTVAPRPARHSIPPGWETTTSYSNPSSSPAPQNCTRTSSRRTLTAANPGASRSNAVSASPKPRPVLLPAPEVK